MRTHAHSHMRIRDEESRKDHKPIPRRRSGNTWKQVNTGAHTRTHRPRTQAWRTNRSLAQHAHTHVCTHRWGVHSPCRWTGPAVLSSEERGRGGGRRPLTLAHSAPASTRAHMCVYVCVCVCDSVRKYSSEWKGLNVWRVQGCSCVSIVGLRALAGGCSCG